MVGGVTPVLETPASYRRSSWLTRELTWWRPESTSASVRLRTRARLERAAELRAQHVRQALGTLGPGWSCLHALEATSGVIDHLVIGPAGVFAVAAHRHEGQAVWVAGDTMLVDGRVVWHVRRSRAQAAEVRARLTAAVGSDVAVTAVVLVVGHRDIEVRHQPLTPPASGTTVAVASADAVGDWLAARPRRLSAAQVGDAVTAAGLSSTWDRPAPSAPHVLES